MALDKVLKIYDENGNPVDYDILASDVKFAPDGKDLPTKLAEMEEEIGEGGYTPPVGGIPKADLSLDVQTSLGKADTALQTETDPTVPAWAKQPNKPTYTAQEVGALPADTPIPTKTSDLNNDSGFITEDDIPEGATVDSSMSSSSDNPVKNKVIKKYVDDGLADKQDTISDLATIRSGAAAGATAYQKPANGIPASDIASGVIPSLNGYVTTSAMNTALATKQDTLTFDDAPTANSNNPVKSGGIKTYVDGKVSITGITTSQDGTFTITQSDGNSFTVDLNHTHPQYLKYQLLVDEAAYNALATKDSGTLYLIPES